MLNTKKKKKKVFVQLSGNMFIVILSETVKKFMLYQCICRYSTCYGIFQLNIRKKRSIFYSNILSKWYKRKIYCVYDW